MSAPVSPLCLWCKHFHMDTGSPHYSELTPGDNFTMSCDERIWRWSIGDSFNSTIRTAEKCPLYEFAAERLQNEKW